MKAGWKIVKLGDVAKIISGRNQREVESPNGPHPIIGSGGEMGRAKQTLCPAETTVVGRKGSINRPFFMTEPFWNVDTAFGISADQNAVTPKFLHYFCLSFDFTTLNKGTTIPSLVKSDIAEIPIPLPPLAEQKRIVALLDESFAGIDEAKAKAEANFLKAKAVFESHLQSALSNGNENWPKRSLEDLLNCGWIEGHLDGNHGSDYPKKEEFVDQGVPYISANCLQDEEIDMTRAKHLSTERAARLRKGIAKNNDVLFAHNATVGPVALLRTNEEKVILGTSLTYYRCNPDYIDPEYLAHYMRSALFKRQYEQIMRQSTRNQIPITKQREFFHIIPPINEQRALVVTLAKLFEAGQVLCRIYDLKCSKLDELRHSLLSQAFAGELTA